MKKNWRTNLGGAISVTGTSLIGIGVLPQLTQLSPNTSSTLTPHQLAALWYVALAGFILSGIGKGVTALFAADAAQLKSVQAQLDEVPKAIDSGDTTVLYRTQAQQKDAGKT